jgi:hypothetical protein
LLAESLLIAGSSGGRRSKPRKVKAAEAAEKAAKGAEDHSDVARAVTANKRAPRLSRFQIAEPL